MIVFAVLLVVHIVRYLFLLPAYTKLEEGNIAAVENYVELVVEEWDQKMITGLYLT